MKSKAGLIGQEIQTIYYSIEKIKIIEVEKPITWKKVFKFVISLFTKTRFSNRS